MRVALPANAPIDVKVFGLGGATFYEEKLEKVASAATVAERFVFVSNSDKLIDYLRALGPRRLHPFHGLVVDRKMQRGGDDAKEDADPPDGVVGAA